MKIGGGGGIKIGGGGGGLTIGGGGGGSAVKIGGGDEAAGKVENPKVNVDLGDLQVYNDKR